MTEQENLSIPFVVTIHLQDIVLFAHHGVFDHEKILGNTFEVNLEVCYESGTDSFDCLEDTVDYAALYQIIRVAMDEPQSLLENICTAIIEKIKIRYPQVAEVSISVFKRNPPIPSFNGKAGITIRKKW